MEFFNKRKLFLNDFKQENLTEFVENKQISNRKKAFDSFLKKTKKTEKLKKNQQEIFNEIKSNLNLNFEKFSFDMKSFMITQLVNFL